jgi:hypothetical protein
VNYYNEIDGKTAAWLRELIHTTQDRLEDNSFGQEACDMLDKEPIPLKATRSSPLPYRLQHVHVRACGLFQEPCFPRRTHKHAERPDSINRNALGLSRGQVLLSFFLGIQLPVQGAKHETFAQMRQAAFVCNLLNISICSPVPALGQCVFRIPCNRALEREVPMGVFLPTTTYNVWSSIFYVRANLSFRSRTGCNSDFLS